MDPAAYGPSHQDTPYSQTFVPTGPPACVGVGEKKKSVVGDEAAGASQEASRCWVQVG